MKTPLRIPLAVLIALAPVGAAMAQDPTPVTAQAVKYSPEQLDNLVAAIALYPDAILAQVLIASTFPEQVDLAARYVKTNGTKDVDDQSWDVSVRSVAHYPPLLNMMSDRPDWTTALGQAYAAQSSDVMQSVQHLRRMASAQGNLVSTAQQTVTDENGAITIEPTQPTVVYVPTYDPAVVYYEPIGFGGPYSGYWSFGVGYPIGGWLSYDCDWYGGVVFYDGWRGGGWRARSRPFIAINAIYVHPGPRFIPINRGVFSHSVNYSALGRFNTIHRSVTFDNHPRGVFAGAFGAQDRRGVPNDDRRGPPNRGNDNRNDSRNDNRGNSPRVDRHPDPRAQGNPGTANGSRVAIPADRGVFRGAPISRQAPPRQQAAPPARQQSAPPRQHAAPPPRQQSAPPSHSSPPSGHSSSSQSHGSSGGSKGSDRR